jgi:hypothetical protein
MPLPDELLVAGLDFFPGCLFRQTQRFLGLDNLFVGHDFSLGCFKKRSMSLWWAQVVFMGPMVAGIPDSEAS